MVSNTALIAFIVSLILTAVLVVFALVMMGMWIWMFADWSKREKTDPETHDRYKLQFLIGWPFNYYFQVYRKRTE